jgi:hypothetical protein
MIASQPNRYLYTIDDQDAMESVNPAWLAFAQENGAAELTREAVLGRPIWNFIEGRTTRQLYRELIHRVRHTGSALNVPFRCDSPTVRRYMRLEIEALEAGRVQFACEIQRVQLRPYLAILDPQTPRSAGHLTICSCCKRVLLKDVGWLELEDALLRLKPLEEPKAPQLDYSLCDSCVSPHNQPPEVGAHA